MPKVDMKCPFCAKIAPFKKHVPAVQGISVTAVSQEGTDSENDCKHCRLIRSIGLRIYVDFFVFRLTDITHCVLC